MATPTDIPVHNTIPPAFTVKGIASGSRSVMRASFYEFTPVDTGNFTPESNKRIRFFINSATDFLVGPESWFEFTLAYNLSSAFALANTVYAPALSFEETGANALFHSVRVYLLGMGNDLEYCNRYNHYSVLDSNLHDNPAKLDSHGGSYFDDVNAIQSVDMTWSLNLSPNYALHGGTNQSNWVPLTSINGTGFTTQRRESLQVGMLIAIYGNGYAIGGSIANQAALDALVGKSPYIGVITGINRNGQAMNTDSKVTIWPPIHFTLLAALAAASTRRAVPISTGKSLRASPIDNVTATCRIAVKLRNAFFKETIPLPLLPKGVAVELELDDAFRVFQFHDPAFARGLSANSAANDSATGDNVIPFYTFSYIISEPRFYAKMITPNPAINDEFVRVWKSYEGLVYEMLQYHFDFQTMQNSLRQTMQFAMGMRSVRKIYAVVSDTTLLDNDFVVSRMSPVLSTWLRSNIIKYQGRVGSKYIPDREVIVNPKTCAQAYQYLMHCAENQHKPARLRYEDFKPENKVGTHFYQDVTSGVWGQIRGMIKQSNKFVMAFDLSRVHGSIGTLSGEDLSQSTWDLTVERFALHNSLAIQVDEDGNTVTLPNADLGFNGNAILIIFVLYDFFWKLSSRGSLGIR